MSAGGDGRSGRTADSTGTGYHAAEQPHGGMGCHGWQPAWGGVTVDPAETRWMADCMSPSMADRSLGATLRVWM